MNTSLSKSNGFLRYIVSLPIWYAARPMAQSHRSNDLGGKILIPGLYKSDSPILIRKGDLTLDAQGDLNAVWSFVTRKNILTTGGAGGNVILKGGAQSKNVFWETKRHIKIGAGTSFIGNLKSTKSITWMAIMKGKICSYFKYGQEFLSRNSD